MPGAKLLIRNLSLFSCCGHIVFLLYCMHQKLHLSAANIRVLDNCINRAVYRIFGVNDSEDMVFLKNSLGLIIV